MTTCYLFAEKLDENGILGLRIDKHGQVDVPLAMHSVESIKQVQIEAQTVIVLPTDVCSLHEVELPWLAERKARAAIPYALEERLAQNVSALHFAFDRNYYRDNCYLIVVINRSYLADLMDKLDKLLIEYDNITVDWFALGEGEGCLTSRYLLINSNDFKGALTGGLAKAYLQSHKLPSDLFAFTDSINKPESEQELFIDEPAFVWIAKRLNKTHILNLCQGEFQKSNAQDSTRFWYSAAAVLTGALLVSFIIMSVINLHFLNKKLGSTDEQIAVIYHKFFPEARQVISPKFRIKQALNASKTHQEGSFWHLLTKFSNIENQQQFTIKQMRFQNQTLIVTLLAKDFQALEKFQQQLQQTDVQVNQTQASSQNGRVLATLELSI